jgi:1,4-alpha-glucan branching enzyme/maltooligosyltrehalose trehalohydrolase
MGEELDASAPFLFFCDFGPDLAAAVTRGRREEFGRFARFREPAARAAIPDPNDPATFERSKLDWRETALPGHRERLALYRELLRLRRVHVAPRLAGMPAPGAFTASEGSGLAVHWTLGDGARLHLAANLSDAPAECAALPPGDAVYANREVRDSVLPPWSVIWTIEAA